MVLPEGDHGAEEVGAAEQWALVEDGGAAEDDVAATAGGEVGAVVGELSGDEAVAGGPLRRGWR